MLQEKTAGRANGLSNPQNAEQAGLLRKTEWSGGHELLLRRANGKKLTDREIDVIELVSKPNEDIAKQLGITKNSVKNYLYVLYKKLNVAKRTELILLERNLDTDELGQMASNLKLSKRITEIIVMAIGGKSNKEIGTALGVTEHTVKNYIYAACKNFSLNGRRELLQFIENQNNVEQRPRTPALQTDNTRFLPAELSVIKLIEQHMANKEIGTALNISEHTVKNYLYRIFKKAKVKNRIELINFVNQGRNETYADLSLNLKTKLTPRQKTIIDLAVQGKSNKEIANSLNLTEHTVKNYMFRTFDKLGISRRSELIPWGISLRAAETQKQL